MKNILAVGAYERDNFGDYLFYNVLKRALPEDNIIPGSVFAGDMRKAYGIITIPYDYVLKNYEVDAVWVVGGEVGGVNVPSALNMSIGEIFSNTQNPYEDELGEKIEKLLGASRKNRRAYIPDLMLYNKNLSKPLVIQSVGLRHIFVGSKSNKKLLKKAERLVVRESESYNLCKSRGLNVVLAPDVVHSLSKFYTPNSERAVKGAILFQVNKSTLDSYKPSNLEKILRHIYEMYNAPILLFAAGTANGHDSIEAYDKVVKRLKNDIDIDVLASRDPMNIVDHIASALLVIGTSLHVRIVAATYNVPRISLHNDKTARYAKEWDEKWPLNVELDQLVQLLKHLDITNKGLTNDTRLADWAYNELIKSTRILTHKEGGVAPLDIKDMCLSWFVHQQQNTIGMVVADEIHHQKVMSDLKLKLEQELAEKDALIDRNTQLIRQILNSKSYSIGRKLTLPYRTFKKMKVRQAYNKVHVK